MILPILLMVLQVGEVVVSSHEPSVAAPWAETFRATCGGQRLEITRPRRPLDRLVLIEINGQPASGDVQALQTDLGSARAAYRLSFTCPNVETTQLRWVSGEADGQGQVRYRAGSATFHQGVLIESRSEDGAEETFWYR